MHSNYPAGALEVKTETNTAGVHASGDASQSEAKFEEDKVTPLAEQPELPNTKHAESQRDGHSNAITEDINSPQEASTDAHTR